MKPFKVVNCGDVDNGKSTFSGRLLYDLAAVKDDEVQGNIIAGDNIDWTYFTDGLESERKNNKTIDIGHRFFYTKNFKVHLMDAPGHLEYIGNTISAILTADHVNLLIDVTLKDFHKMMTYLDLAIELTEGRITCLVNKMDMVGWEQNKFLEVVKKVKARLTDQTEKRIDFIPISAKEGDNVVKLSPNMPWYDGESVYHTWTKSALWYAGRETKAKAIFNVHHQEEFEGKKGLQGFVYQGQLSHTDQLVSLPSGEKIEIDQLLGTDGPKENISPKQPATIITENTEEHQILVQDPLEFQNSGSMTAKLYYWGENRLVQPGELFTMKHLGWIREVEIGDKVSKQKTATEPLQVFEVDIKSKSQLAYKHFDQDRFLGSFTLIDPVTMKTVGLGLMEDKNKQHTSFAG